MAKKVTAVAEPVVAVAEPAVGLSELAQALVTAIELTKPKVKKTAFDRTPKTPWTPKDGSPKLKLKRRITQHGIVVDADLLTNLQIDLFNQLRPGNFLDGWVRVTRRKDKSIDITYPIKTNSQRLRLINQYGIRNLSELLQRCIEEAKNPVAIDVDNDD